MLAEALAAVDKTGERFHEAELYRLKGELSLRMGERAERANGRKRVNRPIAQSPCRPLVSRGVFPQSHRDRSQTAGKILGTPRNDEPRAAVATTR